MREGCRCRREIAGALIAILPNDHHLSGAGRSCSALHTWSRNRGVTLPLTPFDAVARRVTSPSRRIHGVWIGPGRVPQCHIGFGFQGTTAVSYMACRIHLLMTGAMTYARLLQVHSVQNPRRERIGGGAVLSPRRDYVCWRRRHAELIHRSRDSHLRGRSAQRIIAARRIPPPEPRRRRGVRIRSWPLNRGRVPELTRNNSLPLVVASGRASARPPAPAYSVFPSRLPDPPSSAAFHHAFLIAAPGIPRGRRRRLRSPGLLRCPIPARTCAHVCGRPRRCRSNLRC